MKPISNIVYYIQYCTTSFILDLQEHIYKKVQQAYYKSAGVGFGDLSIDVFLEVQNKRYS